MKTYPEMATEYMKTALKEMIEDRNSLDAEEFGFDDGIENWILSEIEYRINWFFTDSIFVVGDDMNSKENVFNNIEYVIHAIDQLDSEDIDAEVLNWLLNENWERLNHKEKYYAIINARGDAIKWLDHEAKYYAIIDVCEDVATWFYNELKSEGEEKSMPKTYIKMAEEYMKAKLMDMMDEIPEYLENDSEGQKWYELDEEDLRYWIRNFFINDDSFTIDGEDEKEMKEMVLANMEYVMYALDMHRGWIDDEEIAEYICSKNWSQLDYEARFEGVDDAATDVAKWLKGELESAWHEKKSNPTPAKAKEPEYTYEYIFLNIGDVVEVRFSNLTTFQLHQIMKNNPEFILSGIIKKEVK